VIDIRVERQEDRSQVRMLNELAFEQPVEADLIEKLRQTCPAFLSLVAEDGKIIVGHILFTPVLIEASGRNVEGMGLAPMAVMPDRQRQGIGSMLAKRGLEMLHEQRCPYVIVLGHPEYYPRFGFERASKHNLKSQWDGVPEEAFMIVVFDGNSLQNAGGVARYRDEFNEAM
jgi:putative acetyltransferase